MKLDFTVNGKKISYDNVSPDTRLIDFLRTNLSLLGTKEGCGEGECGACTILIDNEVAHACLKLVSQVQNREITTIEGLKVNGEYDVIQKYFVSEMAIQCGGCTPGMIMATKGLLIKNPSPTEDEIRDALSGVICRCSGYTQIIRAVQKSSKELK